MKSDLDSNRGIIGWMDYAKTFAIFSVVLLHTHCNGELTVAINGYVMPLFFFLSGYLFSVQRNPHFGKFVYKRFRQLVIPYLWINIATYMAWLLVLRHYGTDAGSGLAWHEPLRAIALGIPPQLVHDIPVWSLLSFFVVETVYYLLHEKLKIHSLTIATVAYATAAAMSLFAPGQGWALPLCVVPATCGLTFYCLGHRAKDSVNKPEFVTRPNVWTFVAATAIFAGALYLNSPTQFFIGLLGNPLWFLLGAIGGIVIWIQVSAYLSAIAHDPAWIQFISRGTLLICGFHLLVFAMLKGVVLLGMHANPSVLTANIAYGLLTAVATTALCCPIIYIVHRWLRPLVSK